MGLDEELEKARKALDKDPSLVLGKKAYKKALASLKEEWGEKAFEEFMKDVDYSDPDSLVNQADRFLDELEEKSGVELCEDCIMKALSNFYKSRLK